MTKTILFSIIFIFLLSSTQSFAESNAHVEVENNVSGNNNINSRTEIKVETNGNVTEYTSDEPNQKIEVHATDDTSEIKVDDKLITETASTEGKTNENEITEKVNEEENVTNDSNVFVNFFKKLFSFLDFL